MKKGDISPILVPTMKSPGPTSDGRLYSGDEEVTYRYPLMTIGEEMETNLLFPKTPPPPSPDTIVDKVVVHTECCFRERWSLEQSMLVSGCTRTLDLESHSTGFSVLEMGSIMALFYLHNVCCLIALAKTLHSDFK